MTWYVIALFVVGIVSLSNTILCAVLFRQLGIFIMGSARGVSDGGIPVGKKLPNAVTTSLTGQRWELASLQGEPYILLFGATYCAECKDIMPKLSVVSDAYGVQIVTAIFGRDAELRDYVKQMQIPDPVVRASESFARSLDVDVTPFAYAVGADGGVTMKGLANSVLRLEEMARSCQPQQVMLESPTRR